MRYLKETVQISEKQMVFFSRLQGCGGIFSFWMFVSFSVILPVSVPVAAMPEKALVVLHIVSH